MKIIRTFINLTVPQYLILVVFTTVSSAFLINPVITFGTIKNLAVVIISLSFAVFGLNSFNQIFDIEIDRISKPLRPLPRKELSVRGVYIFSLLSFSISFLTSLLLPVIFSVLIAFFIATSILYSAPPIRLKRYGISSNIIGGTLYGAVPFAAAWIASNADFPIGFFILFYGLAISIATLKDFEDAETEKTLGIRTLPVLLGYKNSRIFILSSVFLLLIFMLALSIFVIDKIFIYPTLLCFLLLYALEKLNFHGKENVASQSKNVTKGMVIIILMELLYGATSLAASLIAS